MAKIKKFQWREKGCHGWTTSCDHDTENPMGSNPSAWKIRTNPMGLTVIEPSFRLRVRVAHLGWSFGLLGWLASFWTKDQMMVSPCGYCTHVLRHNCSHRATKQFSKFDFGPTPPPQTRNAFEHCLHERKIWAKWSRRPSPARSRSSWRNHHRKLVTWESSTKLSQHAYSTRKEVSK